MIFLFTNFLQKKIRENKTKAKVKKKHKQTYSVRKYRQF